MYKVEPFIWYDIDEKKTIFQTRNATVIITNKDIRDFLVILEERKILSIDETILKKYFDKMDYKEIVNFLVAQKILRREEERKVCIKRVIILSNDIKFNKSIELNISDIRDFLFVNKEQLKEFKVEKNDFLIVFLNPFELKEMEKIVEIVKNKDVMCKFAFSLQIPAHLSTVSDKN